MRGFYKVLLWRDSICTSSIRFKIDTRWRVAGRHPRSRCLQLARAVPISIRSTVLCRFHDSYRHFAGVVVMHSFRSLFFASKPAMSFPDYFSRRKEIAHEYVLFYCCLPVRSTLGSRRRQQKVQGADWVKIRYITGFWLEGTPRRGTLQSLSEGDLCCRMRMGFGLTIISSDSERGVSWWSPCFL